MKCHLYWSDDHRVREQYYRKRELLRTSGKIYYKREDGEVVEVLEVVAVERGSKEEVEAKWPHLSKLKHIGIGVWVVRPK